MTIGRRLLLFGLLGPALGFVMAFWVIDENHARLTGLARAVLDAVCRMSLKISSPSRPASQALTMTSVVAAPMSLCSARSCVWALASRALYRNSSGRMGRSS